jgi:hypothetical protein
VSVALARSVQLAARSRGPCALITKACHNERIRCANACQSKKKRWHSGVPAQHIVDYHVKAGRKPLRKVNDHGRLVEEWDRLKKLDDVVVRESVINVPGLDHLWFGPYRGRKYTVGETKGSVWAQFSFMAGMAQKDKDAVVDTRNDTAAVMDGSKRPANAC